MRILFNLAVGLLVLSFSSVAASNAKVLVQREDKAEKVGDDAEQYSGVFRSLRRMNTRSMTIAQIAASMPRTFSTLVTALRTADLVDTLNDKTADLTVFAPTNQAFAALGSSTVQQLLRPAQRETLKDILLFHVYTGGSVLSNQLTCRQKIPMANGKRVRVRLPARRPRATNIRLRPGKVFVIQADIIASNGVIHVVDAVLIPR